ncbi:MAG: anion permease, partial [Bacteroidales bacterium]|nr:anion permease [Bacteroidales bacterium]
MSNNKINLKYCVLLPIVLIVTIFLWVAPKSFFGSLGDVLTVSQQRTIAIFAFAALMWIFEIVPNWVTSLMVIVISLLTISNKSIGFLMDTGDASQFVPMKELMRSFADPVVMLFLGGFVLAIVASKYGMDVTMARILLKPFGKKPKTVLLGVLLVISVFSMFMSNTATAAMFLAFLAPVFASLPDTDAKGKVGIALAIPIAANVGGIGTPIGTPPNATAVGNLESMADITIGFG